MSSADVETHIAHLSAIFASREDITPSYLRTILRLHDGDVERACDYILRLSEAPPSSPETPRHPSPRLATLAPMLDVSDRARLESVVDSLKEIVLPALKRQLTGLQFPDMVGEAERVKYTLTGLRLCALTLPPSAVTTHVSETRMVDVEARDVSLAMEIDRWAYRMNFPPLRDNGRAEVSFSGVRVAMIFRVEPDGVLRLGDCNCKIEGAVRFRANDARLSWLYNTLAAVLKTVFRPQLEATLSDAVRTAVEKQLEDWTAWTM